MWAGDYREGGVGKGVAKGNGVPGLISKLDFTNGMGKGVDNWTGRSRRHPCRVAPDSTLHGGITLGFLHSVSEIANFSLKPWNPIALCHPFAHPSSLLPCNPLPTLSLFPDILMLVVMKAF